MAVKTPFSDSDFRAILAAYPLGAYQSAWPISAGTVQTNYLVQTAAGRWIFRCYENRTRASVGFECSVIRWLTARHYPCPAVIPDTRGQMVGEWNGKPFVLFEFIDGEHVAHPTPDQERQLVQKVAELQTLTRGCRQLYAIERWNYGPALCRQLALESAQRIGTDNARNKLAWYLGALARLHLPRAHPKGICHCDFHFSNILFKNGQFTALIDFDDANYTYLTFDLVTLMNPFIPAFAWDTWQQFNPSADVLDLHQARGMVAEYSQYRPLSPIEKRHLFDVVKLSILIDCLWYFERGDAADFYEKRKIDALDRFGRAAFYAAAFGSIDED